MPGVNRHYTHTSLLRLVLKKAAYLGETPAMQPPPTFAPALVSGVSNFGQVLNHNRRASPDALDYALGENVVAIPSKPLQSARQLFEMPFSRLCAFGLQFPPDTEYTAVDFFPVASSPKPPFRGHSGVGNTQVNPDYLQFLGRGDRRTLRYISYYVQPEFTFAIKQISTSSRVAQIFSVISGYGKVGYNPTLWGGETGFSLFPFDPITASVIANRAKTRMGLARWVWLSPFVAAALSLGFSLSRLPLCQLVGKEA